jgi:hypothetical protein
MDPLLLAVTLVALVLAIGMAVVAVKLLRGNRDRATSRIEALQALLARSDDRAAEESFDDADLEPAGHAGTDAFDVMTPSMSTSAITEDEVVASSPSYASPLFATPIAPSSLAPSVTEAAPPAVVQTFTPVPPPAIVPAFAVAAPPVVASTSSDAHDESWDLALRPRRAPAAHASETKRRPREIRATRPIAPVEDLFTTPEQRTPSHRWTALATVGAVMALGIGVVYTLATTDVIGAVARAVSVRTGPATTNVGEAPLELLSLRHASESGGEFVLTGLVQNPQSSPSLRGVVAVVYLFDREGRYFASGKATLETPVLASGAEAPFVIRIPAATGVGRYRVGFRHEDGAVVAHVDRRGALPESTTGDAVDAVPAAAPVTRRSEG